MGHGGIGLPLLAAPCIDKFTLKVIGSVIVKVGCNIPVVEQAYSRSI